MQSYRLMLSMDLLRLGEADNWWHAAAQSCCNEDTMASLAQCCSRYYELVRSSRHIKGRAIRILITACRETARGYPCWYDGPEFTLHRHLYNNDLRREGIQDRRTLRAAASRIVCCKYATIHPLDDALFLHGEVDHHSGKFNAIMTSFCTSQILGHEPASGCLSLTCMKCTCFQLMIDHIRTARHAVIIHLKLITAGKADGPSQNECQAPDTCRVVTTCDQPGCTRKVGTKPRQKRGRPPSLCSLHRHHDPPLGNHTAGNYIATNAGRYAHLGNVSVTFLNRLPEHLHSEALVRLAAIETIRKITKAGR